MIFSITPQRPTITLVCIISLFTMAGGFAGFSGGLLVTRGQALKEIGDIRTSYDESQKIRAQALQMCLQLAPKAADSAATAATAAGKAADAARRALEQKVEQDNQSGGKDEPYRPD